MNPSSVIIDATVSTVNFLPWLESQGYHIELKTEGCWITATLVGITQVVGGYGDPSLRPFKGYGKSKEEALRKLCESCSGNTYNPDAKDCWLFLKVGRDRQFPTFTQS